MARVKPLHEFAVPRHAPQGPIRAAAYVRMSTEHQQYSTANQAYALEAYASERGIEIVRTYADQGKSGLRLDGRDALQQLLKDVESGLADFTAVLVYDISRWGRFQDPDESASYEIRCKCVFRAKLDTHSTANWTPIPAETGHPFQRKLDTDSAPNWTV